MTVDTLLRICSRYERALLWPAALMIAAANYLIFFYVPDEAIMGPVQRIFYFHVASAVACYCSFAVVFAAGLGFISQRERAFDILGEAAGEVGFVFCTIVLASGMIWGKAAWGAWFVWEPRLVTFLGLWYIFLGFNLLRLLGDPRKIALHSAVLGVIGSLTVPLMVYSIKLLKSVQQLHPEVVAKEDGLHPAMKMTLFFTMAAVVVFQFLLLSYRTRIGILREEVVHHG